MNETAPGPITAPARLFLTRLAGLVRRRHECAHVLEAADWRMRLLHKATYSTYCDCVALGVGDLAVDVLNAPPAGQANATFPF